MPQQPIVISRQAIIVTIVAVIVVIGIIVGWRLLTTRDAAYQRDLQRIADMREFEGIFERLFARDFSYLQAAASGCVEGESAHTCALETIVGTRRLPTDPGSGIYQVSRAPDAAGYAITFTLERGVGTLSAGAHTLSERGIDTP